MTTFTGVVLIHKVITTIFWFVGGFLLIFGLYTVNVRKSDIVIRVRGLTSIIVIASSLGIWIVIELTRIWEWNAPCFLTFFIVQLIIASISSIAFYRTYSILHKVFMLERAQRMIEQLTKPPTHDPDPEAGQGTPGTNREYVTHPPNSGGTFSINFKRDVDKTNKMPEETFCLRHYTILQVRNRLSYSIVQFAIIMLIFFVDPKNYDFELRKSCYANSSFWAGLFLLALFAVVCIGFCYSRTKDSFHMIEELSGCAIGIIVSFLFFAIILGIEDSVDEQTVRDLQVDVVMLQILIIVVTLIIKPGHWAAVNIRKNLAEGRIKPPLLRILAYDETLRLFREHLVKEWAIENLMFYEAVVAAQVQRNSYSSARSLEKLQRIYFKYIHAEAEFMVNLSAPVANPLHKLFKNPRLLAVLKRHAMHKSKQKTTSKIDMLKVITSGHTPTPRKGYRDNRENKSQQQFARDATELEREVMDHIVACKKEVFDLLQNDSYQRFYKRDDVQKTFQENKDLLFATQTKRKSDIPAIDVTMGSIGMISRIRKPSRGATFRERVDTDEETKTITTSAVRPDLSLATPSNQANQRRL